MGGEAAEVSPEDGPRTKEYLVATLVERLVQTGLAEGKAETLLRLLVLRFGAVPETGRRRGYEPPLAAISMRGWMPFWRRPTSTRSSPVAP